MSIPNIGMFDSEKNANLSVAHARLMCGRWLNDRANTGELRYALESALRYLEVLEKQAPKKKSNG